MAVEPGAAVEPALVTVGPDQLDAVVALERTCFPKPWPLSAFEAELAHSWSLFRAIGPAAAEGGLARLDGFSVAWLLPGDMHLLKLAVTAGRRRSGLAGRLLADSLQAFAVGGGGLASLEVRPSNQAALALYTAFGFVQVAVRRRYYQEDDEDALVLVREVPAERSAPRRVG